MRPILNVSPKQDELMTGDVMNLIFQAFKRSSLLKGFLHTWRPAKTVGSTSVVDSIRFSRFTAGICTPRVLPSPSPPTTCSQK